MWFFITTLSLLCWIEIRLYLNKQKIMSVISEFTDRVNGKFEVIGTAIDGLVLDIDGLKKKIEQLQNSPGEISAEDQALLSSIENRTNTIADKLKLLDEATETVPTPDATANPPAE